MRNNYTTHEFTYTDLSEENPDLAEQIILKHLEQDYCKHKVIRPQVKICKDMLKVTTSIAVTISAIILVKQTFSNIPDLMFTGICIITSITWCILFLKKTTLTFITLYQKYAPEKLRSACLFEPCCSEYMKLAINKYGIISGILRGIKRICRCKYPNGGIDEP